MAENGKSNGTASFRVVMSDEARLTENPIRQIVDAMTVTPNPKKDVIRLSIGDPTTYGNLPPSDTVAQAVVTAATSGKNNGYCPSTGTLPACTALAEHFATDEAPLTAKDVVMASGCSGAISLAIYVLCNPGDNLLVPCPGFSLYKCLCGARGIGTRLYQLLPERSWEADLQQMEGLIDARTKAIVVTNPSNPCGSVYSAQHMKAIATVAARHGLPIISDEVYAGMAFEGTTFHSMASVAPNQPVLTCGGLAKRYLVPGWRLGWVLVHDKHHVLDEVRQGLQRLSTQILGPCTLVQAALPTILRDTQQEFFDNTLRHCQEAATLAYDLFSQVPSLAPVMPQGAMYMMVGINTGLMTDIDNDIQFTEMLMAEESVFCLPGQCFEYPNFFRIVLSVPLDKVRTAVRRIEEFCRRHQR